MFWRAKVLFVLLVALSVFPFSVSAQGTSADCPGALPRRLIVGGMGRVTPGDANNVRAEPTSSAALFGQIPPGGEFQVIGGPVCAEGYEWWRVGYAGEFGWTPEGSGDYWLEPVLPEGAALLAPGISSETLNYFEYNGVEFVIDPALAQAVIAQRFPASDYTPGARWSDSYLEHTEITLLGYPDRLTTINGEPIIRVYPTAGFVDSQPAGLVQQSAQQTLEILQQMLDTNPDPTTYQGPQPAETIPLPQPQLPFLPHDIAYQAFVGEWAYIWSNEFVGLRYLTLFTQQSVQVINPLLVYVYQGISRDGRYYLSVRLPINASGLEDIESDVGDYETWVTTYDTYLEDIAAQLESSTFSPSLDELDILMTNIQAGPPEPAAASITLDNISMTAPEGLATSITGEDHVPEDQWDLARYEFTLAGYPGGAANIYVYRTETFAGETGMFGGEANLLMEQLPGILDAQADPSTFDVFDNPLPDLAPNSAQGLLSQIRYLDFQGGRGYRFVTIHVQNFWAPGNDLLEYNYIGLTDDGRYLVEAEIAIDASNLPEQGGPPAVLDDPDVLADDDLYFETYRQYVRDISAEMNALSASDFTPSLDQLDALMASITIE